MRYQKIFSQMWLDPKFKSLSDDAKLLFNYFLSSPHSNLLGYYVCPDGYIITDLNWELKRLAKPLAELLDKGLIKRCRNTFLTLILNHLKYNPLDNPNVVKKAMSILENLPVSEIETDLFSVINQIDIKHYEKMKELLQKRLAKPFHEPYAKPETETEAEAEAEEKILSADGAADRPSDGFGIQNLAKLWNDKAPPELPRVKIPLVRKPQKLKALQDSLKRNPEKTFWEKLLENIYFSSFMRGKNDRGWKATFDFVVDHANEITDGKYIDNGFNQMTREEKNFVAAQQFIADMEGSPL